MPSGNVLREIESTDEYGISSDDKMAGWLEIHKNPGKSRGYSQPRNEHDHASIIVVPVSVLLVAACVSSLKWKSPESAAAISPVNQQIGACRLNARGLGCVTGQTNL